MNHDLHKYITELIGTFFLVLTIGCTVIAGGVGVIAPLAIGSILMVMIYAGAHISGAHYNPAVTLGVWIRGRLATYHVAPYMIAQVVGALLAGFIVTQLVSEAKGAPSLTGAAYVPVLAEFLFTFALVFVVLNVATSRSTLGNQFYGLAIGFTVLAGAFAVGSISGAAFNPAVAVGLALMKVAPLEHLWRIYLPAHVLGAAAAALVFKFLNPEDN